LNAARFLSRRRARRVSLFFIAAVLFPAAVSFGRSPVIDPIPWPALDDESSITFRVGRFDDSDTGWSADRIGLFGVRRATKSSVLFMHFDYVSFTAGDVPVLDRWPELAAEGAAAGWPGERRMSGWVGPGVGLIGRIGLPLAGKSLYALALDLPLGKDSLYPYGGRNMPVRFHLHRPLDIGRGLELAFGAGMILQVDSPGDELSGEAFSSATVLEGGLTWRADAGRYLRLTADFASGDGIDSKVLGIEGVVPSGATGRFTLGVAQDLAGRSDRVWGTRITLGWTISAPVGTDPVDDQGAGRKADREKGKGGR